MVNNIDLGGVRNAQARRSQRGSLASKTSRDGGKQIITMDDLLFC